MLQGVAQWEEAFALLRAAPAPDEDAPLLPTGAAATALHDQFTRFVARLTPPAGAQPCRGFVAWLEALIGDLDPADAGPPTDAGLPGDGAAL